MIVLSEGQLPDLLVVRQTDELVLQPEDRAGRPVGVPDRVEHQRREDQQGRDKRGPYRHRDTPEDDVGGGLSPLGDSHHTRHRAHQHDQRQPVQDHPADDPALHLGIDEEPTTFFRAHVYAPRVLGLRSHAPRLGLVLPKPGSGFNAPDRDGSDRPGGPGWGPKKSILHRADRPSARGSVLPVVAIVVRQKRRGPLRE